MSRKWLMTEQSPGDGRAPHVARFESIGRKLPETVLSTGALMASTRHRTHIDLESLTGISERRVSTGVEDSLSLAAAAAADCLSRSHHTASDLQTVVSCSITKYRDGLAQWLEPPMSVAIAQQIGAENAATFDISNACAGMLTGVFVVANRIRRGEIDCGMVVSGEFISQLGQNAAKHVRNIMSPELASLTLGDAGAAVILERAPEGVAGISFAGFTTLSEHSRLCLAYPARRDPGARMFTKSQAIQRFAIADTPILLHEALEAVGLSITDIDCVIPHQTSARAIRKGMKEVCAALGGEPKNPAVVTVDRYGNTASTTHSVALVEELEAGRLHAGDRVALIALASGIEIGVVLFTVDDELVSLYGDAA
ncbi:MAG: 3-oxoacyl-ACP synthase III family protein [Acidimicrobiales bacterium]|jgi:3-oxoacyl-[acyl-carrier-protein] synthase-3